MHHVRQIGAIPVSADRPMRERQPCDDDAVESDDQTQRFGNVGTRKAVSTLQNPSRFEQDAERDEQAVTIHQRLSRSHLDRIIVQDEAEHDIGIDRDQASFRLVSRPS